MNEAQIRRRFEGLLDDLRAGLERSGADAARLLVERNEARAEAVRLRRELAAFVPNVALRQARRDLAAERRGRERAEARLWLAEFEVARLRRRLRRRRADAPTAA